MRTDRILNWGVMGLVGLLMFSVLWLVIKNQLA